METTWTGELTALETRSETDSLEDLHARRRELLPEYAGLKAMHGPNGKWDNKRKAMLEALKVRVRYEAAKSGTKVTEAFIDAEAHNAQEYIQFLEEGVLAHARYVELDTLVQEFVDRIKSREIAQMAYAAECRLGR